MVTVREKDIEVLERIASFEKGMRKYHQELGWEWHDVGVNPLLLNRLVSLGYLKINLKTSRHTHYLMTDDGKAVLESREEIIRSQQTYTLDLVEISPQQMFPEIIGHDDIKELLHGVLSLEKPIHVLLVGPPSIAKSLFLLNVERVGGPLAAWAAGSTTSKAGLQDLIATVEPRWLLIDELEKMSSVDQSVLLSLLEGGRLIRTKVGRGLDQRVDIWVIATANSIRKLPPELLSRFAIKKLYQYSPEEFVEVVRNVMISREGISEAIAEFIANSLHGKTQDPRDAIRVARLSKRVGAKRAIELLIG